MTLLVVGISFFIALHMVPFLGRNVRAKLRDSIGTGPYMGVFALLMVSCFVLMVLGWRSSTAELLYVAPAWGRTLTYLLSVAGLVLFVASNTPTNIKRWLRHPQLFGLGLWSAGHLLSNGELRSVLLFGGMGLFAVLAIFLSNKRDGEWQKIEAVPVSKDFTVILIGLLVSAALYYFHGSISGVPLR